MYIRPQFRTQFSSPVAAINDLFDSAFGRGSSAAQSGKAYPLDIIAGDKQTLLRLEAPGFSKSAFQVSVDQGVLSIEISKTENSTDTPAIVATRRLRLPREADSKQITAAYEHGVLQLTLPHTAAEQALTVEIQ